MQGQAMQAPQTVRERQLVAREAALATPYFELAENHVYSRVDLAASTSSEFALLPTCNKALAVRSLWDAVQQLTPSGVYALPVMVIAICNLGNQGWLERFFGRRCEWLVECFRRARSTASDVDILDCFSALRNRRSLAAQLEDALGKIRSRAGGNEAPSNVFARHLLHHRQDNATLAREVALGREAQQRLEEMQHQHHRAIVELVRETPRIANVAHESLHRVGAVENRTRRIETVLEEVVNTVKRRRSCASTTSGNSSLTGLMDLENSD